MSELTLAQKITKSIGVSAGANTFFSPDISDTNNRSVYLELKPRKNSKSLGCIVAKDLPKVAKARVQNLLHEDMEAKVYSELYPLK